jgi:hypothetical protein
MAYIGAEPIVSATRTVTEVTATAGQTVFTANGGYTVGFLDVFINGSKLTSADFTATDGSTVTLIEAAQVSDIVRLEALGTFLASNGVAKTGDTMTGALVINSGVNNQFRLTDGTQNLYMDTDGSGSAISGGAGQTLGGIYFQNSNGSVSLFSGNNLRLTVDSSGRVTMPAQPAFCAEPTGSPQSSGVLQANTVFVNTGGHYSTSTYRFTAPVAGRYFFSVSIINNESTQSGAAHLRINGSVQLQFYAGAPSGGESSFSGSGIFQLAVNDYVDVEAVSGSFNQGYGVFCGYLIG